MVKLNKIYTRTGDGGETGLADGSRVPKHHLRVEAYGAVDEANSAIGAAISMMKDKEAAASLLLVQNELFDLGADLASPSGNKRLGATEAQISRMETDMDRMNAEIPPLDSFILPGGAPEAAMLHLARAITRRAERVSCLLATQEGVNPLTIKYLNRLSDYLFVLCRWLNGKGSKDILWVPGKKE